MVQILLFLSVLSCKLICIDNNYQTPMIFSAHDQRPESFSNNFYVSTKSSSYPDSFRSPLTDQAIQFAILQALIQKPEFCAWRYNLSVQQVFGLLKSDTTDIVKKLLKLDHLTNLGILELWNLCKHLPRDDKKQRKQYQKQVENIEKELKKALLLRATQRKQEYKTQKACDAKELQRLEKTYDPIILSSSSYVSAYQLSRESALQKTKEQNYKKYTGTHDFDEQTIGLCIAKNIDYKKLQHRIGTAMQHQLYDEVADCYKKIAQFFCQPTFGESILVQHSLEFAQQVTQATELEAMELAIALSNMAHCCADTVSSIFTGVTESIHGIAEMIIDPISIAKNWGYCLGSLMNYVAEAMQYSDPEVFGWSQYAQVLEQEHGYDAAYAEAVISQMHHWVMNSASQEKIKVASRLLADSVLYPKFFNFASAVGKNCCSVITQIPEIRFLESFADMYAEHKLVTNLGDVGLNSMQDIGMSLMENEEAFRKNISKIGSSTIAGNKKRIYKEVDYHHKNSIGNSIGGKSRSPKNGQKALDNSIAFNTKGNQRYERRIGVEEDYFVIFDEHRLGEFHGHVRTWNEFYGEKGNNMRNALYKAGIVKNLKTGRM